MDIYSSWPEAFAIKTTETPVIAKLLIEEIIFRYGVPRRFYSDCAQNLTGKIMNAVCERLGIEKLKSTPRHPSSNGFIERQNQVIVGGIANHVNANHNNWDELLPGVLFAHRTAIVRTKGESPYELLFGRLPILPPDIEHTPTIVLTTSQHDHLKRLTENLNYSNEILRKQYTKAQVKSENDNENPDFEQYPVHSYVWLTSHKTEKGRSPKFMPKYSGPHQIVEVIPPVNYRLKTPSGKILKHPVHHDRLKPHKGDPPKPVEDEPLVSITEEAWEEEDDIPLVELRKRLREDKSK